MGTPGSLAGGIIYGAVSGLTDGGFGADVDNTIATFLSANGTENWHNIYMWGYKSIQELSIIGKAFTKTFYSMSDDTHLYSYYQGCSEGGREGLSQVQRFPEQWDGAIIGAPAIRYAFQQGTHSLQPRPRWPGCGARGARGACGAGADVVKQCNTSTRTS